MKKICLTFSILLVVLTTFCQTKKNLPRLNLDFEKVEKGYPAEWGEFGSSSYSLALDSTQVKTGKYAASITYEEGNPEFKAWSLTLPHNYPGKKITLSGYIKTEKVTDGYAGLWMRIDPQIAFNNMNGNGAKGTTDWARYEITLDLNPQRTTQIVFGGLLVGKGKMWLDNLKVTIDGQDIEELKPFHRNVLPADLDTAFDKGSRITSIPVDQKQIENLKSLGLIWGFLKYHHPNIAKGNFNWDYALFRILPQVIQADNNKIRDEVLLQWIKSLGAFPEGKSFNAAASSNVKLAPDLDWITKSNFSTELTSLLLKVKDAKRPKEHYYIGLQPHVGNADFKNENAYSALKLDAGYRLLALYRYWNIIQYYFPYKNLLEEDWKKVLAEFIPKVIAAENETDYTLTILEMIGRIHDTHANILGYNSVLNMSLGHSYAPVELTFISDKPVVTAYYDETLVKETGLQVGDVITAIDHKPVTEIIKERLKYLPASNYPTKLRNLARQLLRTNNSTLAVDFIRNEKTESKVLKTFPSNRINIYRRYQVTDTSFRLLTKDIAYINHGTLKVEHLPTIWKALKNTKGLIIDNRNYPSDFLLYELSKYLLPRSTPFVKFTAGSLEHPGLFTFTPPVNVGRKNPDHYKGKVVIITNEISQSSAEFHAMAYRVNPRATVLGSSTAGADGNVSEFNLPGGISTMISGIGVYYPDGKETQRIGIVPDVVLKPTIPGIKEGRDELKEKAIEIINAP